LVDLGDAQVEALDRLAKRRARSRASLVREAVDEYLRRHRLDDGEEAFGLWSGRGIDGLAFEDEARKEW
jgi:predicted transcriptional regulator